MGRAGLEAYVLLFHESASWCLSLRQRSSVMRQTADLCSHTQSPRRLSAGTADQLSLLACVRLEVRWCKAKSQSANLLSLSLSLW